MNNYTYRVEWWFERIEYVGRCREFPEQRISLNQWAIQKLAGRRPPSLDDFF